jgi:hypothetical protein
MAAPSFFESVPKQELARSQLEVALQLYMQGNEYPAVITLAGAAEEVLGKIALSKGIEPSLKRTVKELVATTKAVWGREVKESDFAELRNRARNELKHFCSGGDVKLDFEHEAAQMLARTLENFLLCTGSRHPGHYAFTSKKVANWRAKQAAV